MTKAEALKLIFAVKAGYPVYYRNVSQMELEAMADIWVGVLEGYTFKECYAAVLTYIRSGSREILQSPGQVVDVIEKLRAASQPEGALTPIEAWQKYVRPAISDGLYHSKENFEKMPEIVKEAINSPDYLKEMAQVTSEKVDTVERSNFINKLYPAATARRAQEARMPASVRKAIEHRRKENEAAEQARIASVDEAPRIEPPSNSVHGEAVERLRAKHNPEITRERKCDICGKPTDLSELITVANDDLTGFKMICKECYFGGKDNG